jgi:hypothetical protein
MSGFEVARAVCAAANDLLAISIENTMALWGVPAPLIGAVEAWHQMDMRLLGLRPKEEERCIAKTRN